MVVLMLPGIYLMWKILVFRNYLINHPEVWLHHLQVQVSESKMMSWMFAVPQRKEKQNNAHHLSNDLQFICSNNNNVSHPVSKLLFLLEKADADGEDKWRSWTNFPLYK